MSNLTQSKEYDNLNRTLFRQSYMYSGFHIVTMPLSQTAAFIWELKIIFINSKLPKASRTKTIQQITKL